MSGTSTDGNLRSLCWAGGESVGVFGDVDGDVVLSPSMVSAFWSVEVASGG